MRPDEAIRPTPWDRAALGFDTFEVGEPTEEALRLAAGVPGHYTVKVDPRSSKEALHRFGFHYCDTLIEPYCEASRLPDCDVPEAEVAEAVAIEDAMAICRGAFSHDRFHRDFAIDTALADRRYERWLAQLHAEGKVFGLMYRGRLAGFIALDGKRMVLHALAAEFRGRGLARPLWAAACRHFVRRFGLPEVESSISAANLPALNLYASLGFRFRNCRDVYHLRVTGPAR
jgi:RimJ/RimL family protein N-acetyltransferase